MTIYKSVTALFIFLAIQERADLAGQEAPENWLVAPKTTIIRDSAATDLIKTSLKALNPQGLSPVADYTLSSSVVLWQGNETKGTHAESAVSLVAWSSSTQIDRHLVTKNLRRSGIETRQGAEATSTSVGDRRAMETLPYLPQPLLQEILDTSLDEVETLPADPKQEGMSQIKVTIRPRNWRPYMRDLKSASFDLFIANDTHLLMQVRGLFHHDRNPRHAVIHSYSFSQYKLMSGYLVPYVVEEQYAGKLINRSTVESVAFNQHLKPSDLQ